VDTRGEITRRVAIACQGGGSHTAFTAGVLKRLLRAEELERYEVVGLSGTSGGAVCALLAWHYLLRGAGARAAEALDAFWRDNSATAPHEQIVNSWILWASNLQNYVAMPAVSPYDNYFSVSALDYLAEEVRMDLTKKQVARNGVAWMVKADTDDESGIRAEGLVEAQFREGKIRILRLRDRARAE
jgi:Patatin-like phospholipase